MDKFLGFVNNFSFSPTYFKAGGIAILFFLLLVSFAVFKRYMNKSTLQGGVVGIFFGVLIALIIEGFLLIAGKTAVTELLGWKNAPKPIETALNLGREKLVNVLGVTDEIPSSYADSDPTLDEAIEVLQSMNPTELKKIKSIICTQ
jgi:hypothetical protein